jgi:Ca2+-transporting ATPase
VTVIATDKTGTLTENRMRVHALEAAPDVREEALAAMVLANDADHDLQEGAARVGDPLEIGLLLFAQSEGIDLGSLREIHPRIAGRPFDSEWKFQRSSVVHEGGPRSYFKGAPEVLLARCRDDGTLETWKERAEQAARSGHRVLALASSEGELEHDLTLLGLVLLWDPPRAEVPAAIATAQAAGVRVVMITGDHPGTAQAIKKTIGLANAERAPITRCGSHQEERGGDPGSRRRRGGLRARQPRGQARAREGPPGARRDRRDDGRWRERRARAQALRRGRCDGPARLGRRA